MSYTSKTDLEAKNAILTQKDKMSLRAFAKSIDQNAGYLSAVVHGKRPASNNLRLALGLPPRAVTVTPCAVCGSTLHTRHRERQPDPVIRLKRLREILDSPYRMS